MELTRLLAVPLTSLDGEYLTAADVIVRPSVVILIDAYRATPERSAAEVGWVQERLDPEVDLILIWPGRAVTRARSFPAGSNTRIFLDAVGEFRRLVSPSGKRRTVLISPASGTLEMISAANPVFAIGHGLVGTHDRGTDRTIDLGDVYH